MWHSSCALIDRKKPAGQGYRKEHSREREREREQGSGPGLGVSLACSANRKAVRRGVVDKEWAKGPLVPEAGQDQKRRCLKAIERSANHNRVRQHN